MNFLKRMNKVINNAPDSFAPGNRYLKEPGLSNPSQTSNQDVYAYDVISWNSETHPDGRGRSFLVKDIEYDGTNLDVTYNDGFKARYKGITPQQARDFVQSDSKGRWAHAHLWKLPYEAI